MMVYWKNQPASKHSNMEIHGEIARNMMNTHVFPYRPKIDLKFLEGLMKHEIHVFGWLNYHELSNIPIFYNWFVHLITNILDYLPPKAPEFQGSLRVFGQVSWASRSWFLFIAKWRKTMWFIGRITGRYRDNLGNICTIITNSWFVRSKLTWSPKKRSFVGTKLPRFWDSKMNQSNIKARFQAIRRHQRNGGYGGCSSHLLWFWTFTEPKIAWGMADSLETDPMFHMASGYGAEHGRTFKKPMVLRCFNMFYFFKFSLPSGYVKIAIEHGDL